MRQPLARSAYFSATPRELRPGRTEISALLEPETQVENHVRAFVATAAMWVRSPENWETFERLADDEFDLDAWAARGARFTPADLHTIGDALREAERFAEAVRWFDAAVAALREEGDDSVDSGLLGWSLHQLGRCLSAQGRDVEALLHFEQAVAELRRGDCHGQVDSVRFGRILRALVTILERLGQSLAAQGVRDEAARLSSGASSMARY